VSACVKPYDEDLEHARNREMSRVMWAMATMTLAKLTALAVMAEMVAAAREERPGER
jgi:hypothetical protein